MLSVDELQKTGRGARSMGFRPRPACSRSDQSSSSETSEVLPPAAVVLIVNVRSAAKRAR